MPDAFWVAMTPTLAILATASAGWLSDRRKERRVRVALHAEAERLREAVSAETAAAAAETAALNKRLAEHGGDEIQKLDQIHALVNDRAEKSQLLITQLQAELAASRLELAFLKGLMTPRPEAPKPL